MLAGVELPGGQLGYRADVIVRLESRDRDRALRRLQALGEYLGRLLGPPLPAVLNSINPEAGPCGPGGGRGDADYGGQSRGIRTCR